MPSSKLDDLPNAGDRWPALGREGFKTVKWGDMEVGLTTLDQPLDCTHQYVFGGLPGGVCPCPHYGYLFEGRIRAKFPGSDWPDEVIEAGEAYFIPSGHVLVYETDKTRCLEINPADALQTCMDSIEKAIIKMGASGDIPAE
ncbi:hypothetical protein [Zhongshania sp.]|uniref:hypothetical protein n=1 Tax=Zhongshania sp. TaxID=1971902 RepID=UPI0035638167